MKDWLQLFKSRRDAGRSLSDSFMHRHVARTSYAVNFSAFQWLTPLKIGVTMPKCNAGYIRAMLLRAVGECDTCHYVHIPTPLVLRADIDAFAVCVLREMQEGGFTPMSFCMRRMPRTLEMSVFSLEDERQVEIDGLYRALA